MAESVVRYLVRSHEIPVYRIYLVGMGYAPTPATDDAAKTKRVSGGRVEVSLLEVLSGAALQQHRSPGYRGRSTAATERSSGSKFGTEGASPMSLWLGKSLSRKRGAFSRPVRLTVQRTAPSKGPGRTRSRTI